MDNMCYLVELMCLPELYGQDEV